MSGADEVEEVRFARDRLERTIVEALTNGQRSFYEPMAPSAVPEDAEDAFAALCDCESPPIPVKVRPTLFFIHLSPLFEKLRSGEE